MSAGALKAGALKKEPRGCRAASDIVRLGERAVAAKCFFSPWWNYG